MPAEWEPHHATWIAWPHEESDWPGKFATIDWVYAEIVRVLCTAELVQIICPDDDAKERISEILMLNNVAPATFKLHVLPTDRS